jgi:hypothetical protein
VEDGALSPDPLPRLRDLCTALPEVTERPSHGEPAWFVGGKKMFVMCADRHHDDRVGCWLAAAAGSQGAHVGAEPDRFFVPPDVGTRGSLGVRLDVVGVDWAELGEL